MGAWSPDSKSHVAHMEGDDFYGSEQSHVVPFDVKEASTHKDAGVVRIEFVGEDGSTKILKNKTPLQPGEVIDASKMDVAALRDFYKREIDDAKNKGVLFSLHLKATMMKISDPVLFGHMLSVYFKAAFEKHGAKLAELGANPNNGLASIFAKLKSLPDAERSAIEADFDACYASRPGLAMVDSSKGITNLHVPSDVIIDASMPVVIRDSGRMWNKNDQLEDVVCIIPDRSYATMYQACIEDCKANGQFDVASMGNVCNVGLMAQKAEEYGSHGKTFKAPGAGSIKVVNAKSGAPIFSHDVQAGDLWRMCQTKDAPIRDWVRLAVSRARATGSPAIFWLDPARAHDKLLISLVQTYLKEYDTSGLDISIATPVEAIKTSMARARAGKDTISVTGNVLRDYLTDLFPIIELGTSAKMLSIVPLLAGGGLFETGAGGSAPKHVQQFVKEGHLRWDSLGEYLALAVSLEELATKTKNKRATALAKALTEATSKLLDNNKSPSRKVKEIDNRGSHFYIAMWWAEAMAKRDPAFAELAAKLEANEETIVRELIDA